MGKLNQSSFLDIIKKLENMNVPKQQQNERQFEANLLTFVAGRKSCRFLAAEPREVWELRSSRKPLEIPPPRKYPVHKENTPATQATNL